MEATTPDEPHDALPRDPAEPARREPARRPERPGPARRRPPPPREPRGDLIKRRLIALGIGIVLLLILLFGIKSCLDAREERAYENYLRDLDALVTNTNQLSTEFFNRFRDPGGVDELEFQAQLGSSRGTSAELYERTEGLDAPGDLEDAQRDLELAFELRRDGVASIVEETEAALGEANSQEAIDQIAADMRSFLASDVLYARAQSEIQGVLDEQGIGGQVPASNFLPEPIEPWLDRLEIYRLLAQVAGETTGVDGDSRGTELSGVLVSPGNVALTENTLNQVGSAPRQIEVSVLNGGLADETDVLVGFELLGSTEPVSGEATIPRINPGESGSAVIPVEGEIPAGDELTLIVTVYPVPGETIVENNEVAYQVTFGG